MLGVCGCELAYVWAALEPAWGGQVDALGADLLPHPGGA